MSDNWLQCTAEVMAFPTKCVEVLTKNKRIVRTDMVWCGEMYRFR